MVNIIYKNEAVKQLRRIGPARILYTFNPKTQTITIQTIDYRGQIYK